MDVVTENQKIAQFHFALAHTRRLSILRTLATSDTGMTFEAIERKTKVKGSSLTHHLRILKESGLVTRKVNGRNSLYRSETPPLSDFLPTDLPKRAMACR